MVVRGSDLVRETMQMFNLTHPLYYSQSEPRNVPPVVHHVDCSGLCCWAMNKCGLIYPESNSWMMAQQGHHLGLGMSVPDALKTPGAWLIQGANEGQTDINSRGHIVIAVGDGIHSLEARGHTAGVGIFIAASLWWDYAMMPPGVVKDSALPAVVKPTPSDNFDPEVEVPVWMPSSRATPTGEVATARCVPSMNLILLEGGARVAGDHPVMKDGKPVHGKHYWTQPPSARVPGQQCVGMIDHRMNHGELALSLLMEFPNGDSGTYKTDILTAA